MKPTVGRIVHYNDGGELQAALIVKVFSDTCVNLVVWNSGGTSRSVTSVIFSESITEIQAGQWGWPARV